MDCWWTGVKVTLLVVIVTIVKFVFVIDSAQIIFFMIEIKKG